jgi:hypothetical protein
MITYTEYNDLVKKYNDSQDMIYLLESQLYEINNKSSPPPSIPLPDVSKQETKNLIFVYNKYNNKHKSKFLM